MTTAPPWPDRGAGIVRTGLRELRLLLAQLLVLLPRRGRVRGVPFFPQLESRDCGTACLTMVLAYHGVAFDREEVRERSGLDRDGVDARSILQAARTYGLDAKAARVPVAELRRLPPGSILHWHATHYVVFERADRDGVLVVDPAFGRRSVPLDALEESWGGVALLFSRSDGAETATPSRAGRRRGLLRTVMRPGIHVPLWARAIALSFAVQALALSLPLLSKVVVDANVGPGRRLPTGLLVAAVPALAVTFFAASLARGLLLAGLQARMDTDVTHRLTRRLFALPFSYFQARSAGDLLLRVRSTAAIRDVVSITAVAGVLDGVVALLYLVLVVAQSPVLGAVVLLFGVVQVVASTAIWTRMLALARASLQVQAASQSELVELLHGVEALKASGAEEEALDHWWPRFADEVGAELARGRAAAVNQAFLATTRFAAPLAVVTVGAVLVGAGRLSLGGLVAANALAIGFINPLSSVVSTAVQFALARTYLERIADVFDTPPEQPSGGAPALPPVRGALRTEGLWFRYSRVAPFVTRDVTLEVAAGRRLGVVGPSGSGKSTLAMLLAGLYRPTSGTITFDGLDIHAHDLRSVRAQVGVVTQRIQLFPGTIRRNVALARPSATVEEVEEAARLACLHDDVARMPMGYDTVLADDGNTLSGGQRQRLALARAFLARPPVLVLDEATSALDSVTEAAILASLAGMGCTQVVVAHRLSTIRDADWIVLLDDGRVVEQGTHADLLALDGAYAVLARAQGLSA